MFQPDHAIGPDVDPPWDRAASDVSEAAGLAGGLGEDWRRGFEP